MDIYDLDSTLLKGQIMVLNKNHNTDEEGFKSILANVYKKNPSEIWCLSEQCYKQVQWKKRLINREEYFRLLKQRYPGRPRSIIGVTGSYGKTSSCFFLNQILRQWGYRSCLSCSMGFLHEGKEYFEYGGLSTPGTASLYRFLDQNKNCDFSIIEVSSAAAEQRRLGEIEFNGGLFTGFSVDHLDMHDSLEAYFQAKKNFIESIQGPKVKLSSITGIECDSFPNKTSYIEGENLFVKDKLIHIEGNLPSYQKQNLLGCLVLIEKIGVEFKSSSLKIIPPKGRMEFLGRTIYNTNIYLDGAHAAEQVKLMLKSLNLNYEDTVIVYGAAGNRLKTDSSTDLEMFPHVFITDDSPGKVDPGFIRAKLKTKRSKEIGNRFEAIKAGLSLRKPLLLILGKSSEVLNKISYKTHCIYYDESLVVKQLIELYNKSHVYSKSPLSNA